MRAARYAARVYNQHLMSVSLSASQHAILEAIGMFGPVTLQELAHELVIERSALQRTLQPLKKANLVQATRDPAHAKRSVYQITAEGKARLESSIALIQAAEVEIAKFFVLPATAALAATRDSVQTGTDGPRQTADPISQRTHSLP